MADPDRSIADQAFRLIRQCEDYSDRQQPNRERALRTYNGEVPTLDDRKEGEPEPEDDGRSKVVSKDVRSNIRKLMPSIMRTILANDRIVEYEATSQEDEAAAQQATDYVNHIAVPECGVERALHDAIFDALVVKTGILKWSAYESRKVVVRDFSGQSDEAMIGLDELGELIDEEQAEDGSWSFRLKEVETTTRIEMEAVPRGAFLIHPQASSIEDSPLVGEKQTITRSELVSRGYDKARVWEIKAEVDPADPDSKERRGEDDGTLDEPDVSKAMQTVLIYDVYAMLDLDRDGIAEWHHLVLAETGENNGRDSGRVVLEQRHVSEVPYAEVVVEREAHQFEGHAPAEDLEDVQAIKTSLLRQTLDNLYWQNNPAPYINPDAFEDLEAVYNPQFGKPMLGKAGFSAADAMQWMPVPFVAEKSFSMLAYLDAEAQDRTGISDASGGLDPETLQNMTATASNMINEAGIAQAEMMVRCLARGGIRKAFKGLLGLVVAHADRPRTVKLKGEWVEMDPRDWNTGMDCTVNVGLGAGTRERDLAVLELLYQKQKELMMALGPLNPIVKPEQIYNTLAKIAETAGFPSADPYFTMPDPQEIQAQQEQAANQPSEAEQKAQAMAQVEQIKAQARAQIEEAQMQADLQVQAAKIEADSIAQRQKLESDKQIAILRGELDLTKQRRDQLFERDKMIVQEGMRAQQPNGGANAPA